MCLVLRPLRSHPAFTQNLEYNVPHGKLNRGLSVVDTAEILLGHALNEEEYYRAAVLGWCVELVRLSSLYSLVDTTVCLT